MRKERIIIDRRQLIKIALILPIALTALLYGGGYISQFLYNYEVWQAAGVLSHCL